jgi:hypothetical protein
MFILIFLAQVLHAENFTGTFRNHEAAITLSRRCDGSGTSTTTSRRTYSSTQAQLSPDGTPITCGPFTMRSASVSFQAPIAPVSVSYTGTQRLTRSSVVQIHNSRLSLAAGVQSVSRLGVTQASGTTASLSATAVILGHNTTASPIAGCPDYRTVDSRNLSAIGDVHLSAAAQCTQVASMRVTDHVVLASDGKVTEFDAEVVSTAQVSLFDMDPGPFGSPTPTVRSLSYTVRFASIWRFKPEAAAPVNDALRILSATPEPATPLFRGDRQGFAANVEYTLGSRDNAELVLQALDANNQLLASSTPRAVARASTATTVRLDIAAFTLPLNDTRLQLRAVLRQSGQSPFLQSPPVEYTYSQATDSVLISRINPPPGTLLQPGGLVTFVATIRYSLYSRPEGSFSLQAISNGGRVLSASPPLKVTRGEGALDVLVVPFAPPESDTRLTLRALLTDPGGSTLAESTVDYAYGDDLSLRDIEVYQIYPSAEDIPLVAGKSTLARVYVALQSRQTLGRVLVELHGLRNGQPLPRSPMRHRAGMAMKEFSRTPERSGFDFVLPTEWTEAGELTLIAKANPDRSIPETDQSNNERSKVFRFEPSPSLTIRYAPICTQLESGRPPQCPSANVGSLHGFARQVYPVAENKFHYLPVPIPSITARSPRFPTWSGFLSVLNLPRSLINGSLFLRELRRFDELLRAGGAGVAALPPYDQLVGWLPDAGSLLGIADGPKGLIGGDGRTFMAVDRSAEFGLRHDTEVTLAHEMGHNYGLKHPTTSDSCGAFDFFPDWPYQTVTVEALSYDVLAQQQILPGTRHDMMGYCPTDFWISRFHYKKLLNSSLWRKPKSTEIRLTTAEPEAAEYLLISGMSTADGPAVLEPAIRMPGSPMTASERGNYCLELHGAENLLHRHCFPLFEPRGDTGEKPLLEAFSFRLPYRPDGKRIALTRDGAAIASLEASAHPPELAALTPEPGAEWDDSAHTLTWSATDPDGDVLTYSVFYSTAGGDWLPLAHDLDETQFEVNAALIHGGKEVRFRVAASDGFHSTSAEFGPVSVTQRPRLAYAPESLDFYNTLTGGSAERTLTLRNTGSGMLEIASLEASAGFTVLTPTPVIVAAQQDFPIRVRFSPGATGVASGTLRLATNDDSRAGVSIPLLGRGVEVATPEIAVSAQALDFGAVAANQTKDLMFRVWNRGPGPLTIGSLRLSNSAFSLPGGASPFSLRAAEERQIRLQFRAASTTGASGTLTIESDDPVKPSVAVALVANGGAVAPAPRDVLLKGDSGVFDVVVGFPSGGVTAYFVTRLTPPSYPATLRDVQIFFSRRSDGLQPDEPIQVLFAANPTAAQKIDGIPLQRLSARVTGFESFQSFAVNGPTIRSGDFIVGFSVVNRTGAYPGEVDVSGISQRRSYISTNGTSFILLDDGGGSGNLAIRATVRVP